LLLGSVGLVETALCLAQALAPRGAVAGQLVAAGLAEALVLGGVDLLCLFEDLLGDLDVGAVLAIGGVGGDPSAVEGQGADRNEAALGAEREDAGEQLGERLGVAASEAGDRGVGRAGGWRRSLGRRRPLLCGVRSRVRSAHRPA
jgi:hypothetical protein